MYYRALTGSAEQDLQDLFNEPEFDIVGVNIAFISGEPVTVLPATGTVDGDSVEYLYAIVPDEDVLLEDIVEDIESCIVEFNSNDDLSNIFSPDSLVSLIEDVDGVFRCRIVLHNITEDSYSEVTENNYIVYCNDNEYYQ